MEPIQKTHHYNREYFDEKDELRQQAITDYAKIIHKAIQDGIDIRGYYWWTWDNFELHLGPSKRFGLYECDIETKERKKEKVPNCSAV